MCNGYAEVLVKWLSISCSIMLFAQNCTILSLINLTICQVLCTLKVHLCPTIEQQSKSSPVKGIKAPFVVFLKNTKVAQHKE